MFKIKSLQFEDFSWHTALSLAVASKVAYDDDSAVKRTTASWGFSDTRIFNVGRTQGFIAENDQVLLVAFRGTDSIADWLGNLNISWVERPYGSIHAGFFSALNLVRDLTGAAIERAVRDKRKIWLTGHSLGGALAALTAGEFAEAGALSGVHTFGQPRLGDLSTQKHFDASFGTRFRRFVNDTDLVTRVPPGFEHVGKLMQFDGTGLLKRAAVEVDGGVPAAQPAMNQAEFEKLKVDIRTVETAFRTSGLEFSDDALDRSVEGLYPSLVSHRISRYVAIISRLATERGESIDPVFLIQNENRKLHRFATENAIEAFDRNTVELSVDSELMPALVRLRDQNWRPPASIRVNSRFGNYATIQAPKSALQALREDASVMSVEASRDGGSEELTRSIPFVKADPLHRPPIDERGGNAIVGLIDTGIDVLHEAFLDGEGNSRILAVWIQNDKTGPSPHALDPAHFTQDFGTVYTQRDIAKFIAQGAVPRLSLRDPLQHGTHVASIAAGRAVGTLGDGVAPDASIIAVVPDTKTRPGDPPSLGYSVSHVDALHFLKSAASGGNTVLAERRPIAVNVSLGMNAGAHDGTSILEGMFDALSGNGRDPGFVIVKSAGNERGHAGHARIDAFLASQPVEWDSLDIDRFEDYIEVWYDGLDELEFKLTAPSGDQSATLSATTPDIRASLGGNVCRLRMTTLHPDNGDSRVVITIVPGSREIQRGRWRLDIEGTLVRSGSPRVDLWIERTNDRALKFTIPDEDMTLSVPGTADTVITVGACHSSLPLRLINVSSYGLTRDRRAKPDVCAPGAHIEAALANTDDHRATIAFPGTSMAAPHVTGALALVLSHRHPQAPNRPQYNARQLRAALCRTAMGVNGRHNSGFGFGMLDAQALFVMLR